MAHAAVASIILPALVSCSDEMDTSISNLEASLRQCEAEYIESERETGRSEALAAAISSKNAPDDVSQNEAETNWDRLDVLVGSWDVNAQVLDYDGKVYDVTASAANSLVSTTEIEMGLLEGSIKGFFMIPKHRWHGWQGESVQFFDPC